MHGADPHGSVPHAATSHVLFDANAMLYESRSRLVYTATIKVWDGASESTLYLGSTEYVTEPDEVPSSQPFRGVLTQPLAFRRSILGTDRIGSFTSGDGSLVFANTDGFYDTIVDEYAIDGREVIVRLGRITDTYHNHLIIFRGVAVDWFADDEQVTVTIRDRGELLNVPVQPDLYAGTGGAEGGPDVEHKRRPRAFGRDLIGVSPVLVDSTLLIYQVNDGAFLGSPSLLVYDRGVALTDGTTDHANYAALAAASVTAGQFETCAAQGYFRLGAVPDGVVFADMLVSTTIVTSPLILRPLLNEFVSYLDKGSFDALGLALVAGVTNTGMFIGPDEAPTVAEVVARFMGSHGGWGGFSRLGLFEVGIFTAPSGDAVAYFSEDDGDIIKLTRDRLPSGLWPPPWRWRVAFSRCYTVFTDFPSTVPAAVRAYFAQPYQLAEATDPTILTDHVLAQDVPPLEAYFTDDTPAQAEADRLLALYSAGYRLYRMTLTRRAFLVDIGDPIHVTYRRYGLDAGRLMRVVEVSENINLADGSEVDQVEIVAFG